MALITVGKVPQIDYGQYDQLLDFPHLYKSINDDFTRPGITLKDALTCTVTWNRNEYPTLQMTYPRDGSHMIDIQENSYIMEDCGYKFPHQLFKITHVTQELDQVVVSGEHIAATLNDCTVSDPIQFANATAQDLMNQVLNTMQPQKDFTFDSKVSKVSNVNVEGGQQAGAILINPDQEGDQAVNSVLGLYGGELEFDNTEIHHSEHAGMDTGIVIDYGKNMSTFQHDISTENMWTGAVFIAKYTPGQAVAKADWGGWASWSSDYSNVGIYAAGGTVEIFNSPVEGHQAIGTLTTGMKLHLGTAIHDGDFTPDGKYQINTVNGDDWYPVSPEDGSGFVDARWISFDKSGSYMVNDITGTLTVQAQDPNDSSGAGSRVSMSGNAVVAYKPGGEIHVYKSPEIGPDHVRIPGWTVKNGTSIHYDMVERNSAGDMWYRIGPGQWLYGPHLSLTQNGAYQSYSNSGYGYIKENQTQYHWDSKHHKMVATTHTVTIGGNSKNHKSGRYWASKNKKEKVHVKSGRVTIDKTIVQGGKTYHHTKYGWVAASSIDYKHNGSVKPSSTDQILKDRLKDHSKVEIYATPDKNNALNWSIPSGTQITINAGHEAKGGDGKTYVEVTYAGKTGWLPEDNIDSDKSDLVSPDANDGDDSSNPNPNIDATTHNEVTVKVGPLYADGFGTDPNVDKVTTVDVSSYIKHDDQDLSGQQADGSFEATEDDIRQVTEAGKNYLVEHRFGHLEVQDTISYQEMSAINANKVQLSLYDYVTAKYDKYHLNEKEEINSFVWDGLAHHYQQITIGKLPIAWQHLLLQQAKDQAASASRNAMIKSTHLFSRIDSALKMEGSDRKAAELGLMKDLGLIKETTDEQGKKIQTALVGLDTFDKQLKTIDESVTNISNEILSGGTEELRFLDASGNQNFVHPTQIRAVNPDGSYLDFNSQGLGFFNSGNNLIRSAITASGQVAAESITAGTINAVTIKSCLIDSALTIGKEGGMNIYVGTRNPHSTLNPLNGGNVIWALSNQYQAMFSSGQIATTGNGGTTRMHPHEVTIGNDMNQALTQINFANHAYYRIKSWVKAWVADYITINGKKRTIWKGGNKGVNMGKLRNLKGQGSTDYTYTPKDEDYGFDDSDGVDSGAADLSDMVPSVEEVEAIKKYQAEMKAAIDNFSNFIKTGPTAPLHFEDDAGNETMQNPTRIVAQGSNHSFELNSNGIMYTGPNGQTYAALGVDPSTGDLKGNFYVDEAYIPKLSADHIETETIHSLGTINGSLAVSDGQSTIQVGMAYGNSEFGIYVGDQTYITTSELRASSGNFDHLSTGDLSVSSITVDGGLSIDDSSIWLPGAGHVMWSNSQYTNLGEYIKAHIDSKVVHGL